MAHFMADLSALSANFTATRHGRAPILGILMRYGGPSSTEVLSMQATLTAEERPRDLTIEP